MPRHTPASALLGRLNTVPFGVRCAGGTWAELVREVYRTETALLLPLLLPSIGVGCALVFVRSFGESNLALMVAPVGYQTAPLHLYDAVGVSGIGQASALEVVLVGVPLLVLLGWR